MDRRAARRTTTIHATDGSSGVEIRVSGDESRCRTMLDAIARVANLTDPRGPYPRRDRGGVSLYTNGEPITFAPDPGA